MPGSLMLGNHLDIIEGFPAVDLQSGANNGDYIDMQDNARIGILFVSGVGTGGDDPILVVQQAKDACGGSVKALCIDSNKAFKKQAATSLASTTAWASASGCICACCGHKLTNATSAEQSAMWYVEYDSSQLDVACGFTHIRATVADVGCNAQPGYLAYVVAPKYPSGPTDVQSSIC